MAILTSSYDAKLGVREEVTIGKYVLRRREEHGHLVLVESVLGDNKGVRLFIEAEDLTRAVDKLFAAAPVK